MLFLKKMSTMHACLIINFSITIGEFEQKAVFLER